MSQNKPIDLKIILLGECGVGKTNIIGRFIDDKFESNSKSTSGACFSSKKVIKNGKLYRLNMWDTGGQEMYRSVTKLTLNEANIVLLVYSITDKHSFDELNYWLDTAIENCSKRLLVAIVGNKIDLFNNEKVTEKQGKAYAKQTNAEFFLVSAKEDKEGIDNMLDKLLSKYIDNFLDGNNTPKSSITINNVENNKNKAKCCSK